MAKDVRRVPCRGCGMLIAWRTTTGGAWMPLDPDPVAAGNIVLQPDGRCRVLPRGERPDAGQPVYQSHWVSCPVRARFRKESRT